jgi:protoheme IX farnesyltransferase
MPQALAVPPPPALTAHPASWAVAATAPAPLSARDVAAAIVELTKPRITRMVTITAGVGFAMAAIGRGLGLWELLIPALGCLAGTALSSAGANALNQWWERRRDALMPRTMRRPLPEGRLTSGAALLAGFTLAVLGVLTLLFTAGPAAALVSAVTILWYVLLYTPLKPITPLNTLVGAVPGALPPLIGWTATAPVFGLDNIGGLSVLREPGGWCLFLLMFVWQIPHFLAIAWMYRDDYAKGGYRMLPIVDPTGRATATTILVWSVTLLLVTLAPAYILGDRLSPVYTVVAALTGAAFIALCIRLYKARTRPNARTVFIASIVHLPLILIVMTGDALLGRLL